MSTPTTQPNRTTGEDVNRAERLNKDVSNSIRDMFEYREWDREQQNNGTAVRDALVKAAETIVDHVPPSADRTTAIRKLRQVSADCNNAISHRGQY
jgi:hypothetical protein